MSLNILKNRIVNMVVAVIVTASVVLSGGGSDIVAYAMEDNAHVIKAGNETLAVVSSKNEADKVIKEVIDEYTGDIKEVKDLDVFPALKAEPAKKGVNPPSMKAEAATDKIIKVNDKEEKFQVKAEGTAIVNQAIKYKTVTKKKKTMAKGTTKVARKGKNGVTQYKQAQTVLNGQVLTANNISSKVVKKPVSRVLNIGTLQGEDVIDTAKRYLGNPYVYGGNSLTKGTDCSGFVKLIFAKYGFNLPRTSSAYTSVGKAISYKNAEPGDILCYSGHVGIYAGNGKIIHASSPEVGIVMWNANYRKIKCVRRVIN